MTYLEIKDSIQTALLHSRNGKTWNELRKSLGLPYSRPCPEWALGSKAKSVSTEAKREAMRSSGR